jgi:flagellar hook-basal body complex protein FliE
MPGTPGAPGGQAQAATPMAIPQGPAISTAGVSFDSILAQSRNSQDSLGTVEQQLNDPNLKLKRSQSHLVRQKLGDANDYMHAAGSKLGANMPGQKMPAGMTGISRFIAMVNDGQDQLVAVQQQLQAMSAQGQQLSPGDMMSVQIKMGLAQQEIEYTSTLLGKVIQSITQIINTQL